MPDIANNHDQGMRQPHTRAAVLIPVDGCLVVHDLALSDPRSVATVFNKVGRLTAGGSPSRSSLVSEH